MPQCLVANKLMVLHLTIILRWCVTYDFVTLDPDGSCGIEFGSFNTRASKNLVLEWCVIFYTILWWLFLISVSSWVNLYPRYVQIIIELIQLRSSQVKSDPQSFRISIKVIRVGSLILETIPIPHLLKNTRRKREKSSCMQQLLQV